VRSLEEHRHTAGGELPGGGAARTAGSPRRDPGEAATAVRSPGHSRSGQLSFFILLIFSSKVLFFLFCDFNRSIFWENLYRKVFT
jgi:hypothetical protein